MALNPGEISKPGFFSQVNWNSFQQLSNINSGCSVVTKPVVEKFNAYAEQFSVFRKIILQLLKLSL